MRVNCDVCGGEPAAVLCCADEAALCSACDQRVHRANKLAGKHRRIPLIHPASDGGSAGDDNTNKQGPLCDVCKERRGLVFCVEDRAILCPDCDEPIHSANHLTANHTRFLLVGAKLGLIGAGDAEDSDDGVPAACTQQQDSSSPTSDDKSRSSVVLERSSDDNNSTSNKEGGAMISDYLTNICPGWRVDDLLFDAEQQQKPGWRDEHVPSMDADLFDVVGAGRTEKPGAWGPSSWTGDLGFEEVPSAAMAAPTMARPAKQVRVRETYDWNNNESSDDVFAVPEFTPPPAKKARPASYWCF